MAKTSVSKGNEFEIGMLYISISIIRLVMLYNQTYSDNTKKVLHQMVLIKMSAIKISFHNDLRF